MHSRLRILPPQSRSLPWFLRLPPAPALVTGTREPSVTGSKQNSKPDRWELVPPMDRLPFPRPSPSKPASLQPCSLNSWPLHAGDFYLGDWAPLWNSLSTPHSSPQDIPWPHHTSFHFWFSWNCQPRLKLPRPLALSLLWAQHLVIRCCHFSLFSLSDQQNLTEHNSVPGSKWGAGGENQRHESKREIEHVIPVAMITASPRGQTHGHFIIHPPQHCRVILCKTVLTVSFPCSETFGAFFSPLNSSLLYLPFWVSGLHPPF